MSGKLVTIASYENPAEAYAAKFRLEIEGIQAYVADETVGNWLPIGAAVGGIKLQVAQLDAERSEQILSRGEALEESGERDQPWRCKKCQEMVDAGFEVCWSCGGTWEDVHDSDFVPDAATSAVTPPGGYGFADVTPQGTPSGTEPEADEAERSNPYYSSRRAAESLAPADIPSSGASEELEELVTRAWRAAVIGIVTCPIFVVNLYSIFLLLRAAVSQQELSAAGHWKYRGAWLVNLLALVIFWCLLRITGMRE